MIIILFRETTACSKSTIEEVVKVINKDRVFCLQVEGFLFANLSKKGLGMFSTEICKIF